MYIHVCRQAADCALRVCNAAKNSSCASVGVFCVCGVRLDHRIVESPILQRLLCVRIQGSSMPCRQSEGRRVGLAAARLHNVRYVRRAVPKNGNRLRFETPPCSALMPWPTLSLMNCLPIV